MKSFSSVAALPAAKRTRMLARTAGEFKAKLPKLKLPEGEPVRFTEGTLVKVAGSPAVYVVSGGLRRPIASSEAFLAFGYQWKDVLMTTDKALALHPVGEPLGFKK